MRLTRKLLAALLAAVLAVLSINSWLAVRRQVQLLDGDMRRDHRVLGQALARELAGVLSDEGEDAARMRATAAGNPGSVRVTWMTLDSREAAERLGPEERDKLANGEMLSKRVVRPAGTPDMLFSYLPLPNRRSHAIELSESLIEEQQLIVHTVRNAILSTLVLLVVTGILISLVGAHFVSRPIEALLAKIRRVATGDLSGEVLLDPSDELGQIAGALNEMSADISRANHELEIETRARIAAVAQLRHAERLMTVGKLASGLAHELGTPLSVVSGRAEMLLLGDTADADTREAAHIIRDQSHRMATIINHLLDFARKHSPLKRKAEVRLAAEKTVALLAPLADKRGVTLELTPASGVTIALVDEGQVQQVLANLLSNALQATEPGGHVRIDVREARGKPPADLGSDPGRTIRISVSDDGCGMSEEVVARIFEPFFTTKDVGEGTGLGLSVSYGIVREHGGWIDVQSAVGRGSTFSVYLPIEGEESSP